MDRVRRVRADRDRDDAARPAQAERGIGRALEHEALLQRENAALSIENSELSSSGHILSLAARLGMAPVACRSRAFPAGAARLDMPARRRGAERAGRRARRDGLRGILAGKLRGDTGVRRTVGQRTRQRHPRPAKRPPRARLLRTHRPRNRTAQRLRRIQRNRPRASRRRPSGESTDTPASAPASATTGGRERLGRRDAGGRNPGGFLGISGWTPSRAASARYSRCFSFYWCWQRAARSIWVCCTARACARRRAASSSPTKPCRRMRGTITDRNGVDLAVSEPAQDISATPYLLTDPLSASQRLAPLLGESQAVILRELSEHTGFVYLARALPAARARAVLALKIAGIAGTPVMRRVYPRGALAAQVLGVEGTEGNGLAGLEYSREFAAARARGTAAGGQRRARPAGIDHRSPSRGARGLAHR